eukprot:UN04774
MMDREYGKIKPSERLLMISMMRTKKFKLMLCMNNKVEI